MQRGMTEYQLLKRPKVKISDLTTFTNVDFGEEINSHIEIAIKYEGYINKAKRDAKAWPYQKI